MFSHFIWFQQVPLVLTCFRLLINEHKETNNEWEMLRLLFHFSVLD